MSNSRMTMWVVWGFLALGLVVYLYRRKHTLDAEAWSQMSG